MLSAHDVRDIRLHEVGETPNRNQIWIVLDLDMQDTVSLCIYPQMGSDAEKKLLEIAKILNNWPPSADKPLPAEEPVGATPPQE
jgi:hypothetical protein